MFIAFKRWTKLSERNQIQSVAYKIGMLFIYSIPENKRLLNQ